MLFGRRAGVCRGRLWQCRTQWRHRGRGNATIQGQGSASVTIKPVEPERDHQLVDVQYLQSETTTFNQPNSTSIALNRVIGGQGPSFLDGTLTANGRVFIINGDGILFGANSVITTAGFLATTNDIRNEDFMAGKYKFNIPGNPSASIVQSGIDHRDLGRLRRLGGAGRAPTPGTITATLGTVGSRPQRLHARFLRRPADHARGHRTRSPAR